MNKVENSRCNFAEDLRNIRERKGISLETIHQHTRVIQIVLSEYEKNCLIHKPHFHRIYLRSLTRAYVCALDMDPDPVLEALDMALDGTYDGRLAPSYKSRNESFELSNDETVHSSQTEIPTSDPRSGSV